MWTRATDAQLEELLEETRELNGAAQSRDIDGIGRLLEKRRICLEDIVAAGRDSRPPSPKRRAVIGEISRLDSAVRQKISELLAEGGHRASEFQKKSIGVMRYKSASFNMSSGQLINKAD